MDMFHGALLTGAILTAVLCRKDRRALGWIAAGAANFVVTAAYQDAGLPHHAAFTGFMDAAVCFGIYYFATQQWEMLLWRVFQGSVLLSILHMVGVIKSHTDYVIALEVCNWLALGVIGGTKTLQLVDRNLGWERSYRGAHQRIHRVVDSLREKRTTPPFHLFW